MAQGNTFVIPTIFMAIDKFTKPLEKMKSGVLGLVGALDTAQGQQVRKLNELSEKYSDLAINAGIAAAAILTPMILAVREAAKFEDEMSSVATIIDTTKESMTDMGNEVLELGKFIPKTLEDMTEALYQLRSDGVQAADAIKMLRVSGMLATAGLGSVTNAANLMTGAMTVFKKDGLNADKVASVLISTIQLGKTKIDDLAESFGQTSPTVAEAGVSLIEFQAATAALTNTTMVASVAQHELQAAVMSMVKPTSEMKQIMDGLTHKTNITGKAFIAWAGGLVPAMEKVVAASQKAKLSTAKVFGRKEGYNAALLLGDLQKGKFVENLEKMKKILEDANNTVLLDAFYKKVNTTAGQTRLFKSEIEILAIKIGTMLLPAVTSLVNKLGYLISGIGWLIDKFPHLSKGMIWIITSVGAFTAVVATAAAAVWAFSKAGLFLMNINFILKITEGLKWLHYGLVYITTGFTSASVATNLFGTSVMGLLGRIGAVIGALLLLKDLYDWFDNYGKKQEKKDKWVENQMGGIKLKDIGYFDESTYNKYKELEKKYDEMMAEKETQHEIAEGIRKDEFERMQAKADSTTIFEFRNAPKELHVLKNPNNIDIRMGNTNLYYGN